MQIRSKIRILLKQVSNYISPHTFIYLVSNDNIFLSTFLKDFTLSIPHTIIQYKNAELFLEQTFIQKPNKKHISVVISDFAFEPNDNFNVLNGVDMFEIIQYTLPECHFIILSKKADIEEIQNTTNSIETVVKNSNAHIRIQNKIQTLYNQENIGVQKELNQHLFSLFIGVIMVLLLVFIVT